MFFREYLSDWDKYSVFLGGIHGLTVIDNLDAGNYGRTLFVIKDSYANCLIPLLIAHYDRLVAVDLRYYREPVSDIYNQYRSDGGNAVLFLYSVNRIMNDSDLLWLR